jgi:hypothetical protein
MNKVDKNADPALTQATLLAEYPNGMILLKLPLPSEPARQQPPCPAPELRRHDDQRTRSGGR